ncbi:hypothetical protein Leryth_015606 [Lithospermum erythrorhizon]|nr:hypothetical protein Leryth_015606 [Lithospermum erythrorhizon]
MSFLIRFSKATTVFCQLSSPSETADSLGAPETTDLFCLDHVPLAPLSNSGLSTSHHSCATTKSLMEILAEGVATMFFG